MQATHCFRSSFCDLKPNQINSMTFKSQKAILRMACIDLWELLDSPKGMPLAEPVTLPTFQLGCSEPFAINRSIRVLFFHSFTCRSLE